MSFDPKQTYSVSLDFFSDVPEKERPCFVYRRINGREYNEIAKTKELEGRLLSEQTEAIYAALRIGLVDWKNQIDPATNEAIPFDAERLPDVLDPVEGMELVDKRLFGARLSGAERKNSE